MMTPQEDIDAFLEGAGTNQARRLDVAIFFAQSMVRELEASVFEWKRAARALQQRRSGDPPAAALIRSPQQYEGRA